MNGVQQIAYRRVPSFKRESGGLYNVYVAVYSRAYAARMRYLHKRGRHGRGAPYSITPRCTWCGTPINRPHGARAMDLHAWITQQVDLVERLVDENEWPPSQTEGVRLRCEADRRILARHRLDPNVTYEPACEGCGTYGDMEMSSVDNLNECPELLDLAHAHGITDEILAGLDRPQPPEPTPAQKRRLRERARMIVPITTSDVPAALRGTRWKP